MFQESAKIIPKLPPYGEKISIKQDCCRRFFGYPGVNHGVLEAMKAPALLGGFCRNDSTEARIRDPYQTLIIIKFDAEGCRELLAYFPAYPALRRKPKVFASYLWFLHLWFCSWSCASPTTMPSRDDAGNYDSLVGFGCRDQ